MMQHLPLTQHDITRLLRAIRQMYAADGQKEGQKDGLGYKRALDEAFRFFSITDADFCASVAPLAPEAWPERFYAFLTASPPNALCFSTSGSTGIPSTHPHSFAALFEEAQSLRPLFAESRRIVSVVPVHHVYGFAFAVMLPKILGAEVLDMPALPTRALYAALKPGDLLLAFPVFWQALLAMGGGRVAENVHALSATAPCPAGLAKALTSPDKGGLAAMTEIYGATELGAVGYKRGQEDFFTLLPHWQRVGEWANYAREAEPHITRASSSLLWPLPDEVQWHSEREFTPLRRKDRAVQVGGVNVFPARVEALLREHPAVQDCAVRLMRREEGNRLKAFIVLKPELQGGDTSERTIRNWLAKRLEPASTPRAIRFGSELPRSQSGKLTDWDI